MLYLQEPEQNLRKTSIPNMVKILLQLERIQTWHLLFTLDISNKTPCSRIPFDKLTVAELVNKFSSLWNPKVYSLIHIHPLLVRILSQMNPVLTLSSYFVNMHFNNILQPTPTLSYFQAVSFYMNKH
jgi:hypothetical protein